MDPSLHPEATVTARRAMDSVWAHLLLLVISAELMALVFPGPGWWPLAWVALAPMGVLAARSRRPKRLLWTGYLVFFLWWMVRITWIWPVTPPGYFGICAVMAAYWTAGLLVLQLLHRAYPVPMVALLPAVWVSTEFLRGSFPQGGFNWFQLGHALGPYLPSQGPSRLGQTADLFGEWAVTFLVCMTNGVIVDLLTQPWFAPVTSGGQSARRHRMRRTIRAAMVVWAATIGAALAYGQYRLNETATVVEPGVAVAVVQTNVPQDNKNAPTAGEEAEWWRQMMDLTRQAGASEPKPALIVWPETMVPTAINPEARAADKAEADYWSSVNLATLEGRPDVEWLRTAAEAMGVELEDVPAARAARFRQRAAYGDEISTLVRELGVALVAGAGAELSVETRFNSAYLYHPDGLQAPQRYDKVHLVPFGEYIPWISESETLKQFFIDHLSPYPYDYSLTRGAAYSLFTVAVDDGEEPRLVTFGTPICFEDVVPAACRAMVYEGVDGPSTTGKRADFLVNITNDGWFAGSAQPQQQLQIATFRCIENRVPMARAVNTGVSGFIDSTGRVGPVVEVEGATMQVAGTVSHVVSLDPRPTLFGAVGRWPVGLLTGLVGLLVVLSPLRLRRGAA